MDKVKKVGKLSAHPCIASYVVTVFISGPGTKRRVPAWTRFKIQAEVSGDTGEKTGEEEEKDRQIIEIPLKEYGVGVMAREIPAEYAKEALKHRQCWSGRIFYRQIQEEKVASRFRGRSGDREDMEKVWEGKAREHTEKN